MPNTVLGLTRTINWFTDSTMGMSTGRLDTYPGDAFAEIVKVDRDGNVISSKQLFLSPNIFSGSDVTFDNKLVLVVGIPTGHWTSPQRFLLA